MDQNQKRPVSGQALDCGHIYKVPESVLKTGSGPTGYASMQNGKQICYDCAYAIERDTLRKADSYFGYLNSRTQEITTWTGETLARVTRLTSAERTVFGRRREVVFYFRATDIHGQKWYGTSQGNGMYARMHRSKVRKG